MTLLREVMNTSSHLHHGRVVLFMYVSVTNIAQEHTHAQPSRRNNDDDQEEEEELEDDYDHNDGVSHTTWTVIIYLRLDVRSGPVQHALEYNDSIG